MQKLSSEEKPVLIVSPYFPPEKGGLSAHTYWLAMNLKDRFNIRVLTSKGQDESDDFQVFPAVEDWHDIDELYNQVLYLSKKCRVLWQYVPHMYGRGGVNKALPEVVTMLADKHVRQMMIAHEIFSPMAWIPHRAMYAMAQRNQWKKMTRHMERIGVSTQAWIDQRKGMDRSNQDAYEFCPSPSNIPLVETGADHARHWKADHGISPDALIIGFFGDKAGGKLFEWVVDAWVDAQDNGFEVAFVVIGNEPDFTPDGSMAPLYVPTGYLSPEEVSRALQAVDVMALPFVSGVSEKRGTFTGALHHGCAVVTDIGECTSEQLRQSDSFVATEVGDREGFILAVNDLLKNHEKRTALKSKASRFYADNFSWNIVADKIEHWIRNPRHIH